jgi:hypothetical protein
VGSGAGAHESSGAPSSDGAAGGAPGGRIAVASLALLALALVAVLVYLLSGGASGDTGPAPGQTGAGDPAAELEAALASGTPAYVLIHSDT